MTLGTATLTTGDATSTTFSGVMSGTGGLTKAGTGVFTLSGANTYTGATTITAGTLQVSGGVAIADTSAVTLANVAGATLDLNGTNETIGSLAGGGATGGNVTLGAGTLTTGGSNPRPPTPALSVAPAVSPSKAPASSLSPAPIPIPGPRRSTPARSRWAPPIASPIRARSTVERRHLQPEQL